MDRKTPVKTLPSRVPLNAFGNNIWSPQCVISDAASLYLLRSVHTERSRYGSGKMRTKLILPLTVPIKKIKGASVNVTVTVTESVDLKEESPRLGNCKRHTPRHNLVQRGVPQSWPKGYHPVLTGVPPPCKGPGTRHWSTPGKRSGTRGCEWTWDQRLGYPSCGQTHTCENSGSTFPSYYVRRWQLMKYVWTPLENPCGRPFGTAPMAKASHWAGI